MNIITKEVDKGKVKAKSNKLEILFLKVNDVSPFQLF